MDHQMSEDAYSWQNDRQNWFDDTINNIDCKAILIDGVNILPK